MTSNQYSSDDEFEVELENAKQQDQREAHSQDLHNRGGILLAEEQGIAVAENEISEKSKMLALQNDIFRTASINPLMLREKYLMGLEGQTVTTEGVRALGLIEMVDVLELVALFNEFTHENDPYGQHDYGSFDFKGKTIIWRIDYYDNNYRGGSPEPTDPKQTKRVLTVMLPTEY